MPAKTLRLTGVNIVYFPMFDVYTFFPYEISLIALSLSLHKNISICCLELSLAILIITDLVFLKSKFVSYIFFESKLSSLCAPPPFGQLAGQLPEAS